MAVLKQELNYSTYQNKLLKVLEDIEKSYKSGMDTSESINRGLESTARSLEKADRALSAMVIMSDKMERAITQLTYEFSPTFQNEARQLEVILNQYGLTVQSNSQILADNTKSVEDNTRSQKKMDESSKDLDREFRASADDIRVFNNGLRAASDFLMKVGDHANEYSEISNNLIYISGMQGDMVRDFRNGLMGVVADLNAATGDYYNPQQAYAQIAATMQGVTGNLEAMEEMARPVLLAQETLDVNISSIATLFNRFYTRYSFSTMSMESMIGDIRKYSAGSAATGEDIVAAQNSLKVIMEYYAKGDEEKLLAYNEQIAKMVGFYENAGFDPNSFLVSLIKEIEGGEFLSGDSATAIALQRGGMSIEEAIASYSDPLKYEEISNAYLQGIATIFSELQGSANRDQVLSSTFKLDPEQAMDIYNFVQRTGNLAESFENYVDTREDVPLTDLVEDKYISQMDKISNWLEQIYAKMANIQEITGIGFTDVATILTSLASILVMKKTLDQLGGLGKAGKSFLAGGRSSLGSLFSSAGSTVPPAGTTSVAGAGLGAGSAMTAIGTGAGLLAGGALVVDGALGMFDPKADNASASLSALELAGGGGAIAGLLAGSAATGPLAPISLAVGALAFFGKAAYENAHALSGNAADVEKGIENIEKSLKEENRSRVKSISDLSYQYSQLTDIEDKRRLLEESGLFAQEDLQNMQEDQLLQLIESYKSAASAMDKLTEGAMKLVEKYFKEEQDKQQSGFIQDLKDAELTATQRKDILSLLEPEITDEKILKKIEKATKDDYITESEFLDILDGGANQWFDKNNLKDQALSVSSMQTVSGYLGWDKEYRTTDSMDEISEQYQKILTAFQLKDDQKVQELWQEAITTGIADDMKEIFGDALKAMGVYGDKVAEGSRLEIVEIPGVTVPNSDSSVYANYDSWIKERYPDYVPMEDDSSVYANYDSWIKEKYPDYVPMEDDLPGYADGTNYVTSDRVAVIHEGEAITPKKYNPAANMNELESLREQVREQVKQQRDAIGSDSREVQQRLKEAADILQEIKDFLSEWKQDNIKRETVAENKNKFSRQRSLVTGYLG